MPATIGVAMSGGVDSSVAVRLLQEQGYNVFGLTMIVDDNGLSTAKNAAAVAKELGVVHHSLDLRLDFTELIIGNFIGEYQIGRTPNPCCLCNPLLKFGILQKKALELGADYMATGHYIHREENSGVVRLFRAKDLTKDQTYVLWRLTQQQLGKVFFPLGDYAKSEIRAMAAKMGLSVAQQSDSQDICFIRGDYRGFLADHIDAKPGQIMLEDGRILGEHKGLHNYTVGQRKGMNIPWHSPLYVLRLDVKANILWLTDDPERVMSTEFYLTDTNWLEGVPYSTDLSVQVRYKSRPCPVKELQIDGDKGKVTLQQPTLAITPGQSAVFYHGNQLLGGGLIR